MDDRPQTPPRGTPPYPYRALAPSASNARHDLLPKSIRPNLPEDVVRLANELEVFLGELDDFR